eukprot:3613005-Rhodomonas_salina.1
MNHKLQRKLIQILAPKLHTPLAVSLTLHHPPRRNEVLSFLAHIANPGARCTISRFRGPADTLSSS